MSKSSRKSRSRKPHSDFPLTKHPRGYWCKKVKGKLHYFGKIECDEKGQAALSLWLEQKDDLLAGRTPRAKREGLTVADGAKDGPATDAIMGHVDDSMAGHYREEIGDDRLQAVVDHVHVWLYSPDGNGSQEESPATIRFPSAG